MEKDLKDRLSCGREMGDEFTWSRSSACSDSCCAIQRSTVCMSASSIHSWRILCKTRLDASRLPELSSILEARSEWSSAGTYEAIAFSGFLIGMRKDLTQRAIRFTWWSPPGGCSLRAAMRMSVDLHRWMTSHCVASIREERYRCVRMPCVT